MKIAIDANELAISQNTGVKVYTKEIIKALAGIDKENEYLLYLGEKCDNLYSIIGQNRNFIFKSSKSRLPFWTYILFPAAIKKDKPDILFMPIQTVPFFRKPKGIKIVVTVHDLAFLIFPDHFTAKDRFLLDFHTRRAINLADVVITPSLRTKKDIIKFYGNVGNKIKIVYHGARSGFSAEGGVRNDEPVVKQPYVLFVGTVQPRKNIARLIEAFEKVKSGNRACNFRYISNLKLVIAGARGWLAQNTYEKAKKSKFSGDIIFTGNVSGDELARLYRYAEIFVLPSLYEGFGLPLLEAMKCGLPCVVSQNSSLVEIARDAVCYIDPFNADDMAEKINSLLSKPDFQKELSKKGLERSKKFSWNVSASRHKEVFESLR